MLLFVQPGGFTHHFAFLQLLSTVVSKWMMSLCTYSMRGKAMNWCDNMDLHSKRTVLNSLRAELKIIGKVAVQLQLFHLYIMCEMCWEGIDSCGLGHLADVRLESQLCFYVILFLAASGGNSAFRKWGLFFGFLYRLERQALRSPLAQLLLGCIGTLALAWSHLAEWRESVHFSAYFSFPPILMVLLQQDVFTWCFLSCQCHLIVLDFSFFL